MFVMAKKSTMMIASERSIPFALLAMRYILRMFPPFNAQFA